MRNDRRVPSWTRALAFLTFTGCIVEAGNPKDDGQNQASDLGEVDIKILSFKDSYLTGFSFRLQSLSFLSSASGARHDIQVGSQLELISATSETQDLARTAEVKAGTYDVIELLIDKDSPINLTDADGASHEIPLNDENSVISLAHAFEISASKATEVIILLDPVKSLDVTSDGQWDFKPASTVVEEADAGIISGAWREYFFDGSPPAPPAPRPAWFCVFNYDELVATWDKNQELHNSQSGGTAVSLAGAAFTSAQIHRKCKIAKSIFPASEDKFEFIGLPAAKYRTKIYLTNNTIINRDFLITDEGKIEMLVMPGGD